MTTASALTYSTILSVVPISAVVFAIARGFGYTKYIEVWFHNLLSSQPQAADFIVEFVNSYLERAKSGVILGIGLVFMLYTVVMLARNVEQSFNNIWHVEDRANLMRTLTDYASFFFLLPIGLILISGLSLALSSVASYLDSIEVIGTLTRLLLEFIPLVLLWLAFVALYIYMPNTRVSRKCVLVPAFIAVVGMQVLQWFYIHAQMWVSNYNAIYGSFAALPLFMLWIQFSWSICLFGAQLSYTNQNLGDILPDKSSGIDNYFTTSSTREFEL